MTRPEPKETVSQQILAWRKHAYQALGIVPPRDECPCCLQDSEHPFRTYGPGMSVLAGCVDAHHTASFEVLRQMFRSWSTVAWHFRPEAVQARERCLKSLISASDHRARVVPG